MALEKITMMHHAKKPGGADLARKATELRNVGVKQDLHPWQEQVAVQHGDVHEGAAIEESSCLVANRLLKQSTDGARGGMIVREAVRATKRIGLAKVV